MYKVNAKAPNGVVVNVRKVFLFVRVMQIFTCFRCAHTIIIISRIFIIDRCSVFFFFFQFHVKFLLKL